MPASDPAQPKAQQPTASVSSAVDVPSDLPATEPSNLLGSELPNEISDPAPKSQTDQAATSPADIVQTPTIQDVAAKISTFVAPATLEQKVAAPTRPDRSTSPVTLSVGGHEQAAATTVEPPRDTAAEKAVGQNVVQDGNHAGTAVLAQTGSFDPSTRPSADPPEEHASKTTTSASKDDAKSPSRTGTDSAIETSQSAAPSNDLRSPPSAVTTSSDLSAGHLRTDSQRHTQELADRVASYLQGAFDRGGDLRVRLEPPDLGRIQVEVAVRDGSMTARLEVETPAARQTILDNISLLRNAIAQTGTSVNRIDVTIAPAPKNEADSDRRQHSGSARQEPRDSRGQEQSNNQSGQRRGGSRRRPASLEELDIEI
jgi:flagellar hook-length control protein FliK